MQQPVTQSLTLHNLTGMQVQNILNVLTETGSLDIPVSKKAGKKSKPENTVSDEEDEDFGKKILSKKDLEEDSKDDADDSEDEEESEDDEDALTFEEVKAALNKYGNKKPEEAKAILLGFNIKSTKELEKHKNKWEPVYRKIQAKLKKK